MACDVHVDGLCGVEDQVGEVVQLNQVLGCDGHLTQEPRIANDLRQSMVADEVQQAIEDLFQARWKEVGLVVEA